MKGKAARILAGTLAVLLVLSYFFLPWHEERTLSNNSGRKKQDIAAGDSLSWTWTPSLPGCNAVQLGLSGMKNGQGLTLQFEVTDDGGSLTASRAVPVAELGDTDTFSIEGNFQIGKVYTFAMTAAGEGEVRLKGAKTDDGSFEPSITETGFVTFQNPVHLYFALGLILLALTPVREQRSRKRACGEKQNLVARLLPWGTFLMILTTGLLLDLKKPLFTIPQPWMTWDEDVHLFLVTNMDLFDVGGLRNCLYQAITWNPGYLPLAVGYNLGEILGFFIKGVEGLPYRCGIIVSTVCYAGMCGLAVKHAPRYKVSFMLAGSIPVLIFQATCMTYDTVVSASIILGIALLLEILDQEERMSAMQAMTVLALLSWGTVAKPAYSIALISLFLIPEARFSDRKSKWLFRALVIALLIWCFAALAVPGAYDNVIEGDDRFAGADSRAQLQGMLAEPIESGLKPVRFFFDNLKSITVTGIGFWAYTGRGLEWMDELYLLLMLAVGPLCACGEDWKRKSLLSPGRRINLGLVAVLAEILLIYAQYLASTGVGANIVGVQPRYFIPVWLPTMLALMWPHGIRKQAGETGAGEAMTVMAFAICCWVNIENALIHLADFDLL